MEAYTCAAQNTRTVIAAMRVTETMLRRARRRDDDGGDEQDAVERPDGDLGVVDEVGGDPPANPGAAQRTSSLRTSSGRRRKCVAPDDVARRTVRPGVASRHDRSPGGPVGTAPPPSSRAHRAALWARHRPMPQHACRPLRPRPARTRTCGARSARRSARHRGVWVGIRWAHRPRPSRARHLLQRGPRRREGSARHGGPCRPTLRGPASSPRVIGDVTGHVLPPAHRSG